MQPNRTGVYASQISGHLWAPNGAYDALGVVTVPSGGAASVTFAGIPQGYKHLEFRIAGPTSAAANTLQFQFNGDTGSNYSFHQLYGDGSSAASSGSGSGTNAGLGMLGAANGGASIVSILDYANASKYKTGRALGGYDNNGSGYVVMRSSVWLSTAAITSVSITPAGGTFSQYCSFALYGVK